MLKNTNICIYSLLIAVICSLTLAVIPMEYFASKAGTLLMYAMIYYSILSAIYAVCVLINKGLPQDE